MLVAGTSASLFAKITGFILRRLAKMNPSNFFTLINRALPTHFAMGGFGMRNAKTRYSAKRNSKCRIRNTKYSSRVIHFMKKRMYFLLVLFFAIFVAAGFFVVRKVQAPQLNDMGRSQSYGVLQQDLNNKQQAMPSGQSIPRSNQSTPIKSQTVNPVEGALSRITKKPFGIYITPKTSPVQPERFQGYHTGADLETTPAEQEIDVPVVALCDGKLLMARSATGYGGVAVQSCVLDGQAVTVVYGHIRLSSVKAKVGDMLKSGDFLANLGTGFSSQTDGERRHLHLGIHKGSGIVILGYVQSRSQLADWIDPAVYLQ